MLLVRSFIERFETWQRDNEDPKATLPLNRGQVSLLLEVLRDHEQELQREGRALLALGEVHPSSGIEKRLTAYAEARGIDVDALKAVRAKYHAQSVVKLYLRILQDPGEIRLYRTLEEDMAAAPPRIEERTVQLQLNDGRSVCHPEVGLVDDNDEPIRLSPSRERSTAAAVEITASYFGFGSASACIKFLQDARDEIRKDPSGWRAEIDPDFEIPGR